MKIKIMERDTEIHWRWEKNVSLSIIKREFSPILHKMNLEHHIDCF